MIAPLAWVALHQGIGRGAAFAFFALLPALLAPEDVGRFTLAYTLCLLALQPAVESGLGTLVAKAAARGDLTSAWRVWRNTSLALATLAASVALIALAWRSDVTTLVLWLATAFALSLPLTLLGALARGLGAFDIESLTGTAQKLALPVGLLAWQRLGAGGAALPARAVATAALVGWLVLLALRSRLRARAQARERVAAAAPVGLGREALVLALGSVLGVLYQRIDLALLGAFTDLRTVGAYFSAARWVECAYVVPFAVMLVLFPRLAARAPSAASWRRLALGFAVGGLATGVVVALAALFVLPRLYARDGAALAGWALALAPTVPLVFVGTFCGQALVARDRAGRALRAGLASLGVNLLVASLIIPRWGARGAAWAAFVTEFAFATLAGWELHRLVRSDSSHAASLPGSVAR